MQVLQEKIECPRCNSHDIHKKGFSKDGKLNKQRYLCFECNYRFVLGGRAKPQFKAIKQLRKRGEIKQLRIEKVILKIKTQKVKIPKIPKVKISVKTKVSVPCPHCHSQKTWKMGFNPISDKGIRTQRYRCSKCLKRFSFDHEGKLIKRGGFQREHVNLGIPCPQCGKTENVRTHGHSRFGKQKYFCVACPRYFVLNPQIGGKKGHIGYVGRRVLNRQPKHIDDLPFVDCSGLLKNFNKFPQTVDSIIAIPCFNCGSESFCQPQECMKLENYLHEGIENETD